MQAIFGLCFVVIAIGLGLVVLGSSVASARNMQLAQHVHGVRVERVNGVAVRSCSRSAAGSAGVTKLRTVAASPLDVARPVAALDAISGVRSIAWESTRRADPQVRGERVATARVTALTRAGQSRSERPE